jgi:phage terminase large subunit-like protein
MIEAKYIRNKSDEEAVKQGCYFDISYAERVRDFVRTFCKLSIDEWAGKPLEFLPWAYDDLVVPLYSWRRADHSRRFSQASVWLPKNSAKTTTMGALSLYELIGSQTPSGNVVIVANTVEEGDTMFRYIWDMVLQSPDLESVLWVRDNIKKIEYEQTRSILKVVSGDRHGKEGKPISLCVYDEMAWADDQLVYDSLKANVQKRRNGLFINISTAGLRRESIGWAEFKRANQIINNEVIDISTLPVVYAADPMSDWKDIETARRCNPAWGVSVFPDKVSEELKQAIQNPRAETSYRTRRLNQFVGSATSWIPALAWASVGEEYPEEQFYGEPVWCGFDPGFKGDLAAYVLIVEQNGVVYLLPRFFCAEANAERKERVDRVPYQLWARTPNTNLYLTHGDTIDPVFIREKMLEDSRNFHFQEIGYDPTRGYDEFRQICEAEYGWTMTSVPQTATYLGPACAYFERAILAKTIRHPSNPVLNWCLENTAVKETKQGLYPHKGSGETQRIDGILASLTGLSRYLARDLDTAQFFGF